MSLLRAAHRLLFGKVWFTSDTHFNHGNILKYCPTERPYASIEQMNAAIIDNWNRIVRGHDTVYHAGDFAMGSSKKWPALRRQLNGKIILIRGNHDRSREKMLAAGFDEVYERLDIKLKGTRLTIRHYPPKPEYRDKVPNIFLHGHVHQEWKRQGQCINVGVDQWQCRPVSLDELLAAEPEPITYTEVREDL